MAETQHQQIYDLLIVTDATASMGGYLRALNESLPRIISVSALTDAFARIGVLAYRDHCGGELIQWSRWCGRDGEVDRDELLSFTQRLRPNNGGDWPEATKTGLAKAYSVMRAEAKTLILLYADAPPHMVGDKGENHQQETRCLTQDTLGMGSSSSQFADWVSAARTLQGQDGELQEKKQAQVFPIVESHLVDTTSPYMYMAHQTKGICFQIRDATSSLISELSMSLLLAWMGVSKAGGSRPLHSEHLTYLNVDSIDALEGEEDSQAEIYFLQFDDKKKEDILRANIESHTLADEDDLRAVLTPRDVPILDFAKRYASDESYRTIVVDNLRKIIREDVSSIALNPVFGSLWRAVCNDRKNPARDELIQEFGSSTEKITRPEEKAKMKAWLEESYNYAEEIVALIEDVPESDRYPCVFLDPTQSWTMTSDDQYDSNEELPGVPKFTRDELLEIGRSCDYRILRRLGLLLVRFTYVNDRESMPAHVASMSEEAIPKIPLALVGSQYNQVFWKILLHIVLPGTKLAARPAALLAALSIRMGIKPLMDAADFEMAAWKNNWNNLEIPETWNANCLTLILDADKDFEARRHAGSISADLPENCAFLTQEDRRLFETLVDYGMLKANINTTLTAKVGWRPEKSKVPIGPISVCTACQFPRSVTMMAPHGICGMCICPESLFTHGRSKADTIALNVAQNDSESVDATWVECSVSACRAQYILYDVDSLRVRPKCHYCRQESNVTAPWVECNKCLNRMIWPEEYRPDDRDVSKDFQCSACSSGRATIVDAETTPKDLRQENGDEWLLRNESKIQKPLDDMSLFKTISAAGIDGFVAKVEVLPNSDTELRIRGKLIHNAAEIKEALSRWIKSRRTEAGTCSLCFSNSKKRDLRSACGRSGCGQKICQGCQSSWYGMNGRGRLINVAALCCPFCRRTPAPGALPRSNIVFAGNLRDAVEESGSWIYGLCNSCGFAKRFMERVCAQGAPAEVSNWDCESCEEAKAASIPGAERRMNIRHCPSCDVATEKLSGCDHIECDCGTHWCFFCGEESEPDQIYGHMEKEHGGLYGVPGVEDEDDW
ncbi:dihydroxyacid dehydratase [Seiridium cupressi]